MKEESVYPYLPEGREILYVPADNEFMKEATKLLEASGCAKQPTAAIVVREGRIIGRGTNASKKVDVCPRVERNYPTGTGYELCKTSCLQEGHSEIMAIRDGLKNIGDLTGADLYLDGHWWICKECWDEIIKAGIARVFLREDSTALYKR